VVSIVTPSYNQSDFLEETIRSVLDQDYPHIEYVVVDDGSTDRSVEIIERYADRLHWWTQQENAGQVAAINRGFEHTGGEVMAYLNSDDTLLPGAVTELVAQLTSEPEALFVYGDSILVDEHGDRVDYLHARPWDVERMITRCDNHVPQPSAFWRRAGWDAVGPMNEDGFYFFDFEFFLRLGALGPVNRVSRPFSTYRLHPESKTMGAPLGKANDYVRFADEFLASPDVPAYLRPYTARGRSSAYVLASEYIYEALEMRRARGYLVRALRIAPRNQTKRAVSLLAKTFVPRPIVKRLRALRERRRRGADRD
jgi:glycosyltransferase involved in cell wall biosynthesis